MEEPNQKDKGQDSFQIRSCSLKFTWMMVRPASLMNLATHLCLCQHSPGWVDWTLPIELTSSWTQAPPARLTYASSLALSYPVLSPQCLAEDSRIGGGFQVGSKSGWPPSSPALRTGRSFHRRDRFSPQPKTRCLEKGSRPPFSVVSQVPKEPSFHQ